jgi:beta-N-acetylhexosaminidase
VTGGRRRARHLPAQASPGDAAAARLLLAFDGPEPPAWVLQRLARGRAFGVSLFTFHNTRDAAQLRDLTGALEAAVPGGPPLLVAADQEGGQLVGLGHATTAFPGAMALGAADDASLTEAVGLATARELRALGVTVCYAPVCDLALDPRNVSLGTRSFGSRPDAVATHAAAFTRGLAAGGVAATAKHYPGMGAVTVDTHHALGVIDRDRDGLLSRELAPFRAAVAAGARLVMTGHFAVPGVTGSDELPATLSPQLVSGLLRRDLGFEGVAITDAIDMRALAQGSGQLVEAIAALRAGVDLLLGTPDRRALRRLEDGLRQAGVRGLVPASGSRAAHRRVARVRRWLAGFERPEAAVVRSEAHLRLARRAAARSITLVRDEGGLVPLRLERGQRLAVVTPEPRDLTPADSSSAEPLDLAGALRRGHPEVVAVRVPANPGEADVAGARLAVEGSAAVVVGTVATDVQPGQARLVEALLGTGLPVVTVALRTPWDLADYPAAGTHLCAWSIVPAALEALADALLGRAAIEGRLSAPVPGLYPAGHGMTRARG